jgi:hypothetical protein
VPRGSVQHLPDLGDEKPEESEDKGPQEAFPVQLDLTTDPQGTTLDVSFLFIGPEEEKLVVLPSLERNSALPSAQGLLEMPVLLSSHPEYQGSIRVWCPAREERWWG